MRFYTYEDEYKVDISKNECELKIYEIFSKYRKDIILAFIGHVAKNIGLDSSFENISKVQKDMIGIGANVDAIIHRRGLLALVQYFYEFDDYSDNDTRVILDAKDVFNLFLLINQILNKTEYQTQEANNDEIPIEILQASMRMSIDLLTKNDIVLANDNFIKFYEKMKQHKDYETFNNILFKNTSLFLDDFLEILKKFKNREKISDIFNLFEKFSVLKYEDIFSKWHNRIPKIKMPLDYRFLEQYPLIKKDDKFYPVDALLIFYSTIRKVYHLLSSTEISKSFRNTFTKEIAEPVVKEQIEKIFKSDDMIILDTNSPGYEYSDSAIMNENTIILIEIKSAYMGLEIRYTDDRQKFKTEFDKRYIFLEGKHQQIKQLKNIQNNIEKFVKACNIEKKEKYIIFSLLVVFDESLSAIGFNNYIRQQFHKKYIDEIVETDQLKIFPFNAVITFNELNLLLKNTIDTNTRLSLLKFFFTYNLSLTDLLQEIIHGEKEIDGFIYDKELKKIIIKF